MNCESVNSRYLSIGRQRAAGVVYPGKQMIRRLQKNICTLLCTNNVSRDTKQKKKQMDVADGYHLRRVADCML